MKSPTQQAPRDVRAVPWDDAREDRVLAHMLRRRAGRARRKRVAETVALGALFFAAWRAFGGVGTTLADTRSSDGATMIAVEKSAPPVPTFSDKADAGSPGTTGGVAGTSGFGSSRVRGSTGLGGNAGTS